MNRKEQKKVLEAFRKVLGKELHNLMIWPDILWQQMYNRLQWEDGEDGDGPVSNILAPEFKKRIHPGSNPWFHQINRTVESESIIRTLKGHTESVESCAFSPDGKKIVSASQDKTLKLWDVESGADITTLKVQKNSAYSCSFSPDGNKILSAIGIGLQLRNAESGTEIRTFNSKWVNSCVFSPDGKMIVAALDNTLKVWDTETGVEISTLEGHKYKIESCAFSPDGNKIVSSSVVKILKIWDVESGTEVTTLRGHTQSVNSCAFSPDGRKIVSASIDKTLKLWDAESGEEITNIKGHNDPVNFCVFSPDGNNILSGGWMTLKLWDTESGAEIKTLKGHSSRINSFAFSTDGKKIVSASRDNTLRLWAADSTNSTTASKGHTSGVNSCAFSPDGKKIATTSDDMTLKLWDVKSGDEIMTRKGYTFGVDHRTFSPDGKNIVSPGPENTIKIWDVKSGAEIKTLIGHTSSINFCTFSPDGGKILSASMDNTLKLWDTESGAEVNTFKGHTWRIKSCTFSPDGKQILSVSDSLKLWDAGSGAEIKTLEGHLFNSDVIFSPDGKQILTISYKTLKLYDSESGATKRNLHTESIGSYAYSPDGKKIVSESSDNTLKLWDAESGAEIKAPKGHAFGNKIIFSPDGTKIVSACSDNTMKLWNINNGEPIGFFPSLGEVKSVSYSLKESRICCGDTGGNIYILDLYGFNIGSSVKETPLKPSTDSKAKIEVDRPGTGQEGITGLRKIAQIEEKAFFLFLEQKLSEGTLDCVKPEDISRRIMGTSERPTAIHQLIKILGSKEEQHRQEAAEILFSVQGGSQLNYPTEKFDILADSLKMGITSDSIMTISACIWATLRLRKADAFDICSLVFLNPDTNIKLIFAGLFGFLKDKRATHGLIVALMHEAVPEVRSAMIWALGKLEDPAAVKVLTGCLYDENSGVAVNAAKALGQIGGAEAMNALESVAKNESISNEVRYQAAVGMLQAAFKTENKKAGGAKQPGPPAEKSETIICKCGYINSSTNKYCKKCGRELK